jgi:hypothetical protein
MARCVLGTAERMLGNSIIGLRGRVFGLLAAALVFGLLTVADVVVVVGVEDEGGAAGSGEAGGAMSVVRASGEGRSRRGEAIWSSDEARRGEPSGERLGDVWRGEPAGDAFALSNAAARSRTYARG